MEFYFGKSVGTLTKDTPYLTLTGELLVVFCEYFWENSLRTLWWHRTVQRVRDFWIFWSFMWFSFSPQPTLDTEKGKKHHYPPVKHAVESPFPDEEITRGEVPALQKAPPARNGSGRHPPLNKQESEGYVVPMEEMLMKKNMEVEDTKL